MEERARPSLEVLAERVRQRELIEKAMQLEIHDLRIELRASLRQDYLTRAEMQNQFVTRSEISEQAKVRREWPVIFATLVVTVVSVINLIVSLRGGR